MVGMLAPLAKAVFEKLGVKAAFNGGAHDRRRPVARATAHKTTGRPSPSALYRNIEYFGILHFITVRI